MAAVDAVVGAAEAIEHHYLAFVAVCSPISMSASGRKQTYFARSFRLKVVAPVPALRKRANRHADDVPRTVTLNKPRLNANRWPVAARKAVP